MKVDIDDLFKRQFEVSAHFKKVFSDLETVKKRVIDFGKFNYVLQFNPGRIGSATADTAKKVSEDECFLCEKHRFPNQIAVEYNENYNILINPFPIFKKHLTIVDKRHVAQEIRGEEKVMVEMAKNLPGFTVFYNSRHSGASAPFHRHFQGCETKELPIFNQWETFLRSDKILGSTDGVFLVFDSTRYFYMINSSDEKTATEHLIRILGHLQEINKSDTPEANVGVNFENCFCRIVIFPRLKHRPREYFEEGENHFTISPGFADMAGIIPCAVESDFNKLTKENITSIFTQVTLEVKDI
ncbi:MAG: DUF4922 domain-containing protein [Bacteroidales bacterium]|nr:DUF4922 domain-containing protein [Bacteroidales bacterium]